MLNLAKKAVFIRPSVNQRLDALQMCRSRGISSLCYNLGYRAMLVRLNRSSISQKQIFKNNDFFCESTRINFKPAVTDIRKIVSQPLPYLRGKSQGVEGQSARELALYAAVWRKVGILLRSDRRL